MLLNVNPLTVEQLLQQYSGGILVLFLTALVMVALLVLVPKLLRTSMQSAELQHAERMKALEVGQVLPQESVLRSGAARTAVLVPSIAVCAAATVTCYLVVHKSDSLMALALTVWCVTGVVSLASITAGVTLMARLAHLDEPLEDEQIPEEEEQRVLRPPQAR